MWEIIGLPLVIERWPAVVGGDTSIALLIALREVGVTNQLSYSARLKPHMHVLVSPHSV